MVFRAACGIWILHGEASHEQRDQLRRRRVHLWICALSHDRAARFSFTAVIAAGASGKPGVAFALNAMIEADRVERGETAEVDGNRHARAERQGPKDRPMPDMPHRAVEQLRGRRATPFASCASERSTSPIGCRPTFTSSPASKQPWVALAPGIPAVPEEYYRASEYWPKASLERRGRCCRSGRESADGRAESSFGPGVNRCGGRRECRGTPEDCGRRFAASDARRTQSRLLRVGNRRRLERRGRTACRAAPDASSWPRGRSRSRRSWAVPIPGCPVEIVFDQGLGDLFVIRVAGNIVAPSQIGSVEFAAEQFGTRLVVVLGHSRLRRNSKPLSMSCNGPKENQSRNLHSIVDLVRPSVEGLLATDLVA